MDALTRDFIQSADFPSTQRKKAWSAEDAALYLSTYACVTQAETQNACNDFMAFMLDGTAIDLANCIATMALGQYSWPSVAGDDVWTLGDTTSSNTLCNYQAQGEHDSSDHFKRWQELGSGRFVIALYYGLTTLRGLIKSEQGMKELYNQIEDKASRISGLCPGYKPTISATFSNTVHQVMTVRPEPALRLLGHLIIVCEGGGTVIKKMLLASCMLSLSYASLPLIGCLFKLRDLVPSLSGLLLALYNKAHRHSIDKIVTYLQTDHMTIGWKYARIFSPDYLSQYDFKSNSRFLSVIYNLIARVSGDNGILSAPSYSAVPTAIKRDSKRVALILAAHLEKKAKEGLSAEAREFYAVYEEAREADQESNTGSEEEDYLSPDEGEDAQGEAGPSQWTI